MSAHEDALGAQCDRNLSSSGQLNTPMNPAGHESPNQRLLSVYPELSNFWDGSGWIVTADRLARAAKPLGIKASPHDPSETVALFDTAIPYDILAIERISGARIKRQSDTLFIEETLGDNLAMTLALELNAKRNADNFLPLEALCEVRLFQVATPEGISVDRTLVGDALVERILPIRSEAIRVLADKVAQRNLVATVTSSAIEQPRYVDARGVNPPDTCLEFRDISFRQFPIGEIARTPASAKKIWVFEDCRQGFAVVSDGKRQYVYSDSPLVRELIASNQLDQATSKKRGFSSRLEHFLEQLSGTGHYGVCLLKSAPELDRERLDLARSVIAHKGECFVKSSRSSDGILVACVRGGAEREAVIQSDSVEVGELLKHYVLHIESIRQAARRPDLTALEKVALHEQVEAVRRRISMAGFLERTIACMEAPIVEEAIPVARLSVPEGFEKVECRLIFQGQAEIELAGHYCKASSNQTAANIACGGHSRRTYDVIYGLHRQHLEGSLSQDEIDKRAEASFASLTEQATNLARECASFYRKVMPRRQLNDFALDICPVWDSTRGTLRFMFLETQFTYGFSGLAATEPPMIGPTHEELMADRIARFKSRNEGQTDSLGRLRRIESNLQMLQEYLGLSENSHDQRPRHAALKFLERRLREEL